MTFEKVILNAEQSKGRKLTGHEKMVIQTFFEWGKPVNAEEVWLRLRKERKAISIATVYSVIRRLSCIFSRLACTGQRMEAFVLTDEIVPSHD